MSLPIKHIGIDRILWHYRFGMKWIQICNWWVYWRLQLFSFLSGPKTFTEKVSFRYFSNRRTDTWQYVWFWGFASQFSRCQSPAWGMCFIRTLKHSVFTIKNIISCCTVLCLCRTLYHIYVHTYIPPPKLTCKRQNSFFDYILALSLYLIRIGLSRIIVVLPSNFLNRKFLATFFGLLSGMIALLDWV